PGVEGAVGKHLAGAAVRLFVAVGLLPSLGGVGVVGPGGAVEGLAIGGPAHDPALQADVGTADDAHGYVASQALVAAFPLEIDRVQERLEVRHHGVDVAGVGHQNNPSIARCCAAAIYSSAHFWRGMVRSVYSTNASR